MDHLSTFVLAPLAKKVTGNVLDAAGRRVAGLFALPQRRAALERCVEAGILAVGRTADGDADRDHIDDLVRQFFAADEVAEDVGYALAPLLRGHPLDAEEMTSLFNAAGFDAASLPGFDPGTAWDAFAGAFSAVVLETEELREQLKANVLLDQLELQRETLEALRELARKVLDGDGGGAHRIEGFDGDLNLGAEVIVRNDWEKQYLRSLVVACDGLELTPIDERTADVPVRLSDVYTGLELQRLERRPGESVDEAFERLHDREAPEDLRWPEKEDDEKLPIAAVEAIGARKRLVVLGRPGGGKSTLVNHLVVQLARWRQGHRCQGKGSGERLPGWDADDKPLPLRILLRRFAAWLPENASPGFGLVWDYVRHQLKKDGCEDAFEGLKNALMDGDGIVFFDGLDEVHEDDAAHKRTLICDVVRSFAELLDGCRVVVTCREYAYNKGDAWRLPEGFFEEVTLAPFRQAQVAAFTETWYRVVAPSKGWSVERAKDEAAHLARAVKEWEHLRVLAESPLLLTLMAQIHGRDGYLPRDRADLYERAVDLLLAHWENRLVRDLHRSEATADEGQVLGLQLPITVVRKALEKVAFAAHERQEKEAGRSESVADIPAFELRECLKEQLGSYDRAQDVIVYIQQRAGLLLAVDRLTYRFPHRTFQEYLAARYILQRANYDEMLAERVRRDLGWWREVFLLTAGASKETPRVVADLVDQLVPRPPALVSAQTAAEAKLAAQALESTGFVERAKEDPDGRFYVTLEKIQKWLVAAMKTFEAVEPKERADCGAYLAVVGDPRPEVMTVAGMEFCWVPPGEFWMGSDQGQENERPVHLNEHLDYGYWMGRFPVTVAQFREYVDASGAKVGDQRASTEPLNNPVVWVNWREATAFCSWLTSSGILPSGWEARLPSEAEWEKAARGGIKIGREAVVKKIGEVDEPADVLLMGNVDAMREFPWAGTFDANRCNVSETEIYAITAVGCFPNGRSVYRCEEMSGNISEWTRSLMGNYPYDPATREKNAKGNRSVRGGIWVLDGNSACCTSRFDTRPDIVGIGFRIMLSRGKR